MYLLRFKRDGCAGNTPEKPRYYSKESWEQVPRFAESEWLAREFNTVDAAKLAIKSLQELDFPKNFQEWEPTHLALLKLYGNTWEDLVEGMLIDMDSDIKAQIVSADTKKVVKTIRLKNPTWKD